MEASRPSVPSDGEYRSLERSHSIAGKGEAMPSPLSASAPTSVYRQLRQHRNSWPTIDVAANPTAKTVKRKYVYIISVIQPPNSIGSTNKYCGLYKTDK